MPLTRKGGIIKRAMRKTYGSKKKADEVFYASENAGTISGVHKRGQNPRSHRKKKPMKRRPRSY